LRGVKRRSNLMISSCSDDEIASLKLAMTFCKGFHETQYYYG
jgi:hypothetical protein